MLRLQPQLQGLPASLVRPGTLQPLLIGQAGAAWGLVVDTSPGWFPVATAFVPYSLGGAASFLAGGVLPSNGQAPFNLQIPDVPALDHRLIWFQCGTLQRDGTLSLSNPWTLRVLPR
jgi:hypothetical protein